MQTGFADSIGRLAHQRCEFIMRRRQAGHLRQGHAEGLFGAYRFAQLPQREAQKVMQVGLEMDQRERLDGALGSRLMAAGGMVNAGFQSHGAPVVAVGAAQAARVFERARVLVQGGKAFRQKKSHLDALARS